MLDTSSLVASPAIPFYLEFQLVDGSKGSSGDENNTATVSGFDFGGGAASAPLSTINGASGDLNSSVTITDTEYFNQFYQAFLPGSQLHFDVELTTYVDAADTPDRFSFAILYGNLVDDNLYEVSSSSYATLGSDLLLGVDLSSATPPVHNL